MMPPSTWNQQPPTVPFANESTSYGDIPWPAAESPADRSGSISLIVNRICWAVATSARSRCSAVHGAKVKPLLWSLNAYRMGHTLCCLRPGHTHVPLVRSPKSRCSTLVVAFCVQRRSRQYWCKDPRSKSVKNSSLTPKLKLLPERILDRSVVNPQPISTQDRSSITKAGAYFPSMDVLLTKKFPSISTHSTHSGCVGSE